MKERNANGKVGGFVNRSKMRMSNEMMGGQQVKGIKVGGNTTPYQNNQGNPPK
jgi:hypothetical protein